MQAHRLNNLPTQFHDLIIWLFLNQDKKGTYKNSAADITTLFGYVSPLQQKQSISMKFGMHVMLSQAT